MTGRYHGAVVDVTGTEVRQFDTDDPAEMAGWLTAQIGNAFGHALAASAWDMDAEGVSVDVDTLRERAGAEHDALAAQVAALAEKACRLVFLEEEDRAAFDQRKSQFITDVAEIVRYGMEEMGSYPIIALSIARYVRDGSHELSPLREMERVYQELSDLLADIPAAGRELLAERDELRARLAAKERESDCLALEGNALAGKLFSAETALREIRSLRVRLFNRSAPGYMLDVDPRRIADAYFAAAAPEEKKR